MHTLWSIILSEAVKRCKGSSLVTLITFAVLTVCGDQARAGFDDTKPLDQILRELQTMTPQPVREELDHAKTPTAKYICPTPVRGIEIARGMDRAQKYWLTAVNENLDLLNISASTWTHTKSTFTQPERVVFSPSGTLAVIGGKDTSIQSVELPSLRLVKDFGFRDAIWNLRFLDDTMLISEHAKDLCRLWNAKTGDLIRELPSFGHVIGLATSPNLVWVVFNDRIVLRDLTNPQRTMRVLHIAPLNRTQWHIWDGYLLDSGKRILLSEGASRSIDNCAADLVCIDTVSGRTIWRRSLGSYDFSMLADDRYVHAARGANIIDAQTGIDAPNVKMGDSLAAVAFALRITAFAGEDNNLVRYNGGAAVVAPKALVGWETLCFSADGHYAAGAKDNTVSLLAAPDWKLIKDLHGHSGKVTGLVFSPDSKRLVSWGSSNLIRVWNVQSGAMEATLPCEAAAPVVSVRFSNNGKFLLWATGEEASVFDAASLKLQGHAEFKRQVTDWLTLVPEFDLSDSGQALYVSGERRFLTLDLSASKRPTEVSDHPFMVFGPNEQGNLGAFALNYDTDSPTIRIVGPAPMALQLPTSKGLGRITSLAYSLTKGLLAVSFEKLIMIVDVARRVIIQKNYRSTYGGPFFLPSGNALVGQTRNERWIWRIEPPTISSR